MPGASGSSVVELLTGKQKLRVRFPECINLCSFAISNNDYETQIANTFR